MSLARDTNSRKLPDT